MNNSNNDNRIREQQSGAWETKKIQDTRKTDTCGSHKKQSALPITRDRHREFSFIID